MIVLKAHVQIEKFRRSARTRGPGEEETKSEGGGDVTRAKSGHLGQTEDGEANQIMATMRGGDPGQRKDDGDIGRGLIPGRSIKDIGRGLGRGLDIGRSDEDAGQDPRRGAVLRKDIPINIRRREGVEGKAVDHLIHTWTTVENTVGSQATTADVDRQATQSYLFVCNSDLRMLGVTTQRVYHRPENQLPMST